MKFNKKTQYFFLQRSYRKSKKMIAGLDLSLRHSAIVILDCDGQMVHQETIDCETKKMTKSRPHDIHELHFKVNGVVSGDVVDITINQGDIDHIQRIMVIEARMESLLKKFKVEVVGVEGYAFAKGKAGMVFQIGELGGLIKCMLRKLKLTSYIIPPTSLKSYIAGNGHAKKPEMQSSILKKYGVAFEDDNEADAFALAHLVLELGEETTLYCVAGGPDAFRRDVETMKNGSQKKKFKIFKGIKKETWIQKVSHFIPLVLVALCFYLYNYHNVPLYSPTAMFGGLVPVVVVGSFIYLFVYSYLDPDDLTNNVKANKVFAPFAFIAILCYAHLELNLAFFGSNVPYFGALPYASLFTLIFMYTSEYFQPDLDVFGSRPGMTHFPTGQWVGHFKWGRFLRWFFKPVTILWYHLWTPYAFMFTHRGISHYPITSTWLRVGYLWAVFKLIALPIKAIGFYFIPIVILIVGIYRYAFHKRKDETEVDKISELIPSVVVGMLCLAIYPFYSYEKLSHLFLLGINLITNWCELFYPWNPRFMSSLFILYCLPVYLTDFIHISVDYFDAFKRGLPYCPPRIPRGFFEKMWQELKKNF